MPRVARHYYAQYRSKTGRDLGVTLVLFGVTAGGRVEVCAFESPHFRTHAVPDGFYVTGSGGPTAARYLADHLERVSATAKDLRAATGALISGLESALQGTSIDTVGGLFQCVLVDADGIRPYSYGFMDLNPVAPSRAKSIDLVEGRWVQQDLAAGTEIPLVEPASLVRSVPRLVRVHDPSEVLGQLPTWHLSYFVTCLEVEKTVFNIEFRGVIGQVGGAMFPIVVSLIAALGVWGTPGTHDLLFSLELAGQNADIHLQSISIPSFPEEYDAAVSLLFNVPEPGPAFLECWIGGQLLGRRSLYFGQTALPPKDAAGDMPADFLERQVGALVEAHRRYTDPVVERDGGLLVYLVLCHTTLAVDTILRFEGRMMGVYWKSYPLSLRVTIAAAFRLSRGEHRVRMDLVHSASRRTSTIATTTASGSSSCIVTPVHGEVIVAIAEPGLYFVNAYVDDRRVGTVLLAAETDRPQWSYSLLPEDLAKVSQGELLILLRGASDGYT